MRKEKMIVIFYILYFSWLLLISYFSPNADFLNYFSYGITIFYFLFLREKGDFIWFWAGVSVPLITASVSVIHWSTKIDFSAFRFIPIWLPLAWGITIVSLRKLYFIVTR